MHFLQLNFFSLSTMQNIISSSPLHWSGSTRRRRSPWIGQLMQRYQKEGHVNSHLHDHPNLTSPWTGQRYLKEGGIFHKDIDLWNKKSTQYINRSLGGQKKNNFHRRYLLRDLWHGEDLQEVKVRRS